MALVMKWTLPSQKQALTPPGWRLRAWACQFGQLRGRLSLEQPKPNGPMPEVAGRLAVWRARAQSSMSSENSLVSLGVVQSPMAWAAVTLAPATPMAHTPRRSWSFRPARTSLNMITLELPSAAVIPDRSAPQFTPKMPPAFRFDAISGGDGPLSDGVPEEPPVPDPPPD